VIWVVTVIAIVIFVVALVCRVADGPCTGQCHGMAAILETVLPQFVTAATGCDWVTEITASKKKKKKRGYTVCSSGYAATDTS
jgi:hypothetical protein